MSTRAKCRKRFFMFTVVLFSLLLSQCDKDDDDPISGPKVSPYVGVWQGTTGQSLPLMFRVTQEGKVDSLSVRIRVSTPMGTCTGTFFSDTVIAIQSQTFAVPATLPGSNIYTTVRTTFSSTSSTEGSYEKYSGSYILICGGYLIMGSGGTPVAAGTWQATKSAQ